MELIQKIISIHGLSHKDEEISLCSRNNVFLYIRSSRNIMIRSDRQHENVRQISTRVTYIDQSSRSCDATRAVAPNSKSYFYVGDLVLNFFSSCCFALSTLRLLYTIRLFLYPFTTFLAILFVAFRKSTERPYYSEKNPLSRPNGRVSSSAQYHTLVVSRFPTKQINFINA